MSTVRNQQGFTLLEVLISLALLGIIAAGFLGSLSTSSRATIINDEQTTAQNLAEGQIEHVRGQPYDNTNNPPQYELLSNLPEGYSIDCTAIRLDPEGDGSDDDDGLQKIVVTVHHRDKTATTLEAYKVR